MTPDQIEQEKEGLDDQTQEALEEIGVDLDDPDAVREGLKELEYRAEDRELESGIERNREMRIFDNFIQDLAFVSCEEVWGA